MILKAYPDDARFSKRGDARSLKSFSVCDVSNGNYTDTINVQKLVFFANYAGKHLEIFSGKGGRFNQPLLGGNTFISRNRFYV